MAILTAGQQSEMVAAQADFAARYPSYGKTARIDELRAREYRRLDERGEVYLDYTGGGLYADSQLREHLEMLSSGVFGNPHSTNPTSTATTGYVERTRRLILDYFRASAGEYILVFTLNASGALKLVGESFPFAPGGRLLLAFDNHNSVNGIREFARAKGAAIGYAPVSAPGLRLDEARLEALLGEAEPGKANLFAYPAQSNFSGVKHPLELVALAQARGWDVLLDAAAFVPTSRLDLSAVRPDFVSVSFYKMFGYPTGVGALLMRTEAAEELARPWFAGGTVNFATVQAQEHVLASGVAPGSKAGTPNYLSIPAVEIGLRHLERDQAWKAIAERVRCLTGWLLEQLLELRHGNGATLVRIYGPANTEARGGTITFNLCTILMGTCSTTGASRSWPARKGSRCAPGASAIRAREEIAEGLTEEDMRARLDERLVRRSG